MLSESSLNAGCRRFLLHRGLKRGQALVSQSQQGDLGKVCDLIPVFCQWKTNGPECERGLTLHICYRPQGRLRIPRATCSQNAPGGAGLSSAGDCRITYPWLGFPHRL